MLGLRGNDHHLSHSNLQGLSFVRIAKKAIKAIHDRLNAAWGCQWASPDFVDTGQGHARVCVRVEMNCCSSSIGLR